MNKDRAERPVFLNPFAYRHAITAVTSIMHRITGMLLFLAVAMFLYLTDLALESDAGFELAKSQLTSPIGKLLAFLSLSALGFHLVAGVRHLLMDLHIGDSLQGGRAGSIITLVLSAVLIALVGAWIWL